jgi:peptide-methionine (R)-S-oxide reductase
MDIQKKQPSACSLESHVNLKHIGTIQKTDEEWKEILSPIQYHVSRQQGTEPPHQNEYCDNKKAGLYFSICSETPLFSSKDKYNSGSGWPSFSRTLSEAPVGTKTDTSHGMERVEVHCRTDGAHLGHVFDDGPPETGKRYCINSASLKFVPYEKLNKELQEKYFPNGI